MASETTPCPRERVNFLPPENDVPTIRSTVRSKKQTPPRSTMTIVTLRQLIRDVSAGIRVLQTRDGMGLSEEQILERARNIVTGLMGNYNIESLDEGVQARSGSAASRDTDDDDLLDAPAASDS